MRTQMLEVLRQDYIRQARASGLSEAAVIWKHALKNALVAMVPVIAIQIGFLLGYSEKTVRNRFTPIYRKLGAANRVEAIRKAEAYGLLGTDKG